MNNAGTWWLKGAWIELGIEQVMIDVIAKARQCYASCRGKPVLRILKHGVAVLVRKNETLAFMPLFENMTRLPHLDTYDDAGLGWLTETAWVYQSDTLEHY